MGRSRNIVVAAVVMVVCASGALLFRSLESPPTETRARPGDPAARTPQTPAAAPELAEAEAIAATQSAELGRLRAENEALRGELAQVKRHEQELVAAAAAAAAANPKVPAKSPQETAPETRRLRVAFGPWVAKVAELSKIDWREAGDAMRKLGSLVKTVLAKQAAGEDPTAEAIDLAKENVKLQKLALALNGKLPTHTTGNGEFTHPVVLANLMASALEGAGLPLTDDQAQAIAAIGDEYDGKWSAIQATYGATTPVLEEILDELELKKTFCDRMDALLTAAQSAALFDPDTRDELQLDLYSPMLMLLGVAAPLGMASAGDLEAPVVSGWLASWKVDDVRRPDLERLFAAWLAASAPRTVPAAQVPFVKYADAMNAGRATVVTMKDALRTLVPTADQTKAILASKKFVVPRLIQAP
jgi:hypothetical protein